MPGVAAGRPPLADRGTRPPAADAGRLPARRVLRVSFLVDLLDVATNLFVALWTGSATIFSEMAQGLADSTGSLLLVIGERRARRPRDAAHPLGYTREAFFWGLLSAIAMLVIGAGLSAWRGVQQLLSPEPLAHTGFALAVLMLSIATNGYAVRLSVRKLREEAGGLREAFRRSSRPLVKNALLRDAVGTLTSVLGLVALGLYGLVGAVVFDAIGALLAAGLMAGGSLALMAQARALIAGRSLPPAELARLREAVTAIPEVVAVNRVAAVYAGPKEVLIEADLDLAEDLDTSAIEAVLDRIEARARAALPDARWVRVQLNSPLVPLTTTQRAT